MADRERRIQEIAYLLWEGEGRPDGQAERFWHMAEAAVDAENEMGGGDKPESVVTEAATTLADVSFAEAETPAPEAPAPKKPKAPKAAKAKVGETPTISKVAEPEPAIKSAAKPKAKK